MSEAARNTDGTDPFDAVHNKEEAIEAIADRDWKDHERIGAVARMILDLAHGDQPNAHDLEIAGIPVGPTGDFVNWKGHNE